MGQRTDNPTQPPGKAGAKIGCPPFAPKGFLSVSMAQYLELLDWTGRQLRDGKVGVIPEHLSPILSRMDLGATGWCDVVCEFGRVFKRAAGTPESLAKEAIRCGQHWLCVHENPLGLSSD